MVRVLSVNFNMETEIRLKIQINLFKNFSYTYSRVSKIRNNWDRR